MFLAQKLTNPWSVLWATLILITIEKKAADSPNLVVNIVVAFAAAALGGSLGYGVIPALVATVDKEFESVRVWPTKLFMSVLFVLQISALLGWFAWVVCQRRREGRQREREVQLTPAGQGATAELECSISALA